MSLASFVSSPSEYLAPFLSRCPPSSMPLEVKRASLDATEKAAGEAWKCKQFKRRVKEINGEHIIVTFHTISEK